MVQAQRTQVPDSDPYTADPSSGYGQGRNGPPLRGGVLVTEQSAGEHAVGELLRQPTVRGSDGVERRIDELFGPGFAVVGRQETDLRMGPEARGVLERLGGRAVSLEGLEIVEGEMDRLSTRNPSQCYALIATSSAS